jgi:isopenicillin-N epimerase
MTLSRRDFNRLLALTGSAALVPTAARAARAPFDTDQSDDEAFWTRVRGEFSIAEGLAVFNAANLCPSSRRVTESLERHSRNIDRDPSPANRASLGPAREASRAALAKFLRVTPDEIVITRNTSEANNLVSSGLDFRAGDVVIVFADNHPSNLNAWREKATRFGFTVTTLPSPNPHPGTEAYVDSVAKAITSKTKLIAITHVTSTVGDLLPVAELCRLARERGVLSLVDGAQSFGVLDVNLGEIKPDFYSGSAHKWPCGARETGVLFVASAVQDKLFPSVISLYGGAAGVSRRLEAHGQRDEAAMVAFGEAIALQNEIGIAKIEKRARALTGALIAGLRKIDGVKVWTEAAADRSAAIVSFLPAALDVRRLSTALYDKDRIVCATRGGTDRAGLRFSPHFYNSMAEVDRSVAAIARYVKSGV